MAKTKIPPLPPSISAGSGADVPVFASTGPVGHRKRMRQRVLAHGAGGLADYELLEMLLFYGVPRRDTKPLAKSLLNRFGSFAATLESAADVLHAAGAPQKAAALCAQLPDVAAGLVHDGSAGRAYLGDWDSLLRHCTPYQQDVECSQMRVLLLDSRNMLLVDEPLPWCVPIADADVQQGVSHVLQRALEAQACAVVTVHVASQNADVQVLLQNHAAFVAALHKAAPLLAVNLHDHLVIGDGTWASARQMAADW